MTTVREATIAELPDALNVIDGAALQVDADRLAERIEDGEVLVAVEGGAVLGALVLDGETVPAIAVRRGRRDQGIGTALVAAATQRRERLVAEFDDGVRPFWESLGFEIREVEAGRLRGELHERLDELAPGSE